MYRDCTKQDERFIHVLLVEDNMPSLHVLKRLVSQFTPCFMTAVDAESAFQLIQLHPFDLMITDIGLPGLSGDELTEMVRAYEREHALTQMKIVGLTGYALSEISQRCLDAGMDAIYAKPILTEQLKSLFLFDNYSGKIKI